MQQSQQIKSNLKVDQFKITTSINDVKQQLDKIDFNSLFAQCNALQEENHKLTDKNFQLMFRVFLLTVNTERLTATNVHQQKTIETLTHKFHETENQFKKELEKQRHLAAEALSSKLKAELEAIASTHHTEISRYEERIRSLQKQISGLETQVNELGDNLTAAEGKAYQVSLDNNKLRDMLQDNSESFQKELQRLSLNHEHTISALGEDHQRVLKSTVSSLETEKLKEISSLKLALEAEFKKQLEQKNTVVENLREENSRKNHQIENLNDELKSLNDRLIAAHQEIDHLKDHISEETARHKSETHKLRQVLETQKQEEVERTQKMLTQHHDSKISEMERVLKKQKEQIIGLEQDLQYQGGEKDMLARQLAEVNKEKDEWRSKF